MGKDAKGPGQGQAWDTVVREGCWLRQGLPGAQAPAAGGPRLDQAGRLGRDREAAVSTPGVAGGIWEPPSGCGNKGRTWRAALGNSLSCSGKRTSREAADDDPSRLGPQLETRSRSPIARTSGALKLASPRQPPPPSRIRGAAGHFRCRQRLGQRASCACADVAGLIGAGVAGRVLWFGLVSGSGLGYCRLGPGRRP